MAIVIKLGGYKFKVIRGELEEDEKTHTLGIFDAVSNTIYISNKITDEKIFYHTLLHELVHAIFYTIGRTKLMLDENLVHCVTDKILDLFQNNPKLREKLFGGDRNAKAKLQTQHVESCASKRKAKEERENEPEK